MPGTRRRSSPAKTPTFTGATLAEAIDSGQFPEWELGLQIVEESEAGTIRFRHPRLDEAHPGGAGPRRPVGKLTLNRNPDNFFAETEQVAFHTGNIVPGIDFSDDPLLQGRLHSYLDTQLTRLGGPNFHEIPINRPICPMHSLGRDGFHRQTISKGRINYEPSSIDASPVRETRAGTGRLLLVSRRH